MPIDSNHPKFSTKNSELAEDAYEGDVLDYVPRLSRQSSEQYEAYRRRGAFYNITQKTVEAAVGIAIRKPPKLSLEWVNVSTGRTFHDFIADQVRNVIVEGRIGILIDFDKALGSSILVDYDHDDIVNWRDDGSLVVLKEHQYVPSEKDPYELKKITQFRELYLDQDGLYAARLWQKQNGTSGKWTVVDHLTPTKRGERLNFIPFVFANPFDNTPTCHNPPILNVAQLNISHFLTTVDLEHAIHFTALPQPWISGEFQQDAGSEIAIGSDYPWLLEPGSSVGYLEFTGTGIAALENRLETKERQMFSLGGKLLSSKNGVESSEALKIRSGSENASLITIITSIESAIVKALEIYTWWNNEPEPVFSMNRDFSSVSLEPQQIQALINLYSQNLISLESFLQCLTEGEIISSVEDEMDRLTNGINKT